MNLAMLLDLPSMIVPDSTVVVDIDGREVTYFELREAVAKAAGMLRANGVEVGDRVGIFATNRIEVVEMIFAAASVGATSVPMNYRAVAEEAAHLLADSGTKLLVTEIRYRDLIESVRPASLQTVLYLDDGSYATARDEAEPDYDIVDADENPLAALLYTSGTTSLPKGVMLKHEALSGYVMGSNDAADGEPHGRQMMAAPLYHIAGVTSLFNALYSGRETALMSQFDPTEWLAKVAELGITHAFLVPTMVARLVDEPAMASADLSSLEAITYGAAPMPPAIIRRAIDLFPNSVGFAQAYGQTETTSTVSVLDPDDHKIYEGTPAERESKLRRLSSVGKVLDDVTIRVVDPDGNIVGPNVAGEVQLLTFRAMDGYWGAQEKTRVTIDDEGWVHTGDMGYVDEDEYLFLVGRAGDMIIRGGENVAPDEVEAVLYEHPDIIEAGVVGVPDETWGEKIGAALVLRAGGGGVESVEAHLKERLAGFKRPDHILIVKELPRTSTGKLLRRDLLPLFESS